MISCKMIMRVIIILLFLICSKQSAVAQRDSAPYISPIIQISTFSSMHFYNHSNYKIKNLFSYGGELMAGFKTNIFSAQTGYRFLFYRFSQKMSHIDSANGYGSSVDYTFLIEAIPILFSFKVCQTGAFSFYPVFGISLNKGNFRKIDVAYSMDQTLHFKPKKGSMYFNGVSTFLGLGIERSIISPKFRFGVSLMLNYEMSRVYETFYPSKMAGPSDYKLPFAPSRTFLTYGLYAKYIFNPLIQ